MAGRAQVVDAMISVGAKRRQDLLHMPSAPRAVGVGTQVDPVREHVVVPALVIIQLRLDGDAPGTAIESLLYGQGTPACRL